MDRSAFDRRLVDGLAAAGRFAVRLTGDAASAEDLLHDSIVRATRSWQTYRAEARFQTWWIQIIVNVWRDRLRHRPRDAALSGADDRQAEGCDDPPAAAQGRELATTIAAMVSKLPPRQREVFVLMTYEAFDIAAVADVLGISAGDVRTNLSLARSRLRRSLAPYLNESPSLPTRGANHER